MVIVIIIKLNVAVGAYRCWFVIMNSWGKWEKAGARRWYNKGNETSSLSCGERFRSNAPHWNEMKRASGKEREVAKNHRLWYCMQKNIVCRRSGKACKNAKMRSICFSCYFIRSKNNAIPCIHNHGRMHRIQVNPSNRFVHYWLIIMDRKHSRKETKEEKIKRTNERNKWNKEKIFWLRVSYVVLCFVTPECVSATTHCIRSAHCTHTAHLRRRHAAIFICSFLVFVCCFDCVVHTAHSMALRLESCDLLLLFYVNGNRDRAGKCCVVSEMKWDENRLPF